MYFYRLVVCSVASFVLLAAGSLEAQQTNRDIAKIAIEEIKGGGKKHAAPVANELVVRVSASRKVMRVGILVSPIEKLAENTDVVDWAGNWQRIHKFEPQLWVPAEGQTYIETPPITVKGKPGPQTFLVQAVAELPATTSGSRKKPLVYTKPQVVRMTLATPVASGSIPTEARIAGDWRALELFPKQRLNQAVIVGGSLFAILDNQSLIEIDVATLKQKRLLKLPQPATQMRRAGELLAVLCETSKLLLAVDTKSLKVREKLSYKARKVEAFKTADRGSIACLLLSQPTSLMRFDLGAGSTQSWLEKDIYLPGGELGFSKSMALAADGSNFYTFADGVLHRVRFAGKRVEVKDSSPKFTGAESPLVVRMGNEGLIGITAASASVTTLLKKRNLTDEALLIFKPDDLSKPIGHLPHWSKVFDVDDATGAVVSSAGDGVVISVGTRLPLSRAGYPTQGDAKRKLRMLTALDGDSPYSGSEQVLFIDGRILAISKRGTFLLTPPESIYAGR